MGRIHPPGCISWVGGSLRRFCRRRVVGSGLGIRVCVLIGRRCCGSCLLSVSSIAAPLGRWTWTSIIRGRFVGRRGFLARDACGRSWPACLSAERSLFWFGRRSDHRASYYTP